MFKMLGKHIMSRFIYLDNIQTIVMDNLNLRWWVQMWTSPSGFQTFKDKWYFRLYC